MVLDFNTNDSRLGWLVSEDELGEVEWVLVITIDWMRMNDEGWLWNDREEDFVVDS